MKFGHRIQGTVTDYDDKGRGTFLLQKNDAPGYDRGEGKIAVPFTAVGDSIEATFVKRDQGVKICKLETVVTPSTDRVTPPCPHAGQCGGCLWQHLAYPAQLRIKQDMMNRAFERAGHAERIENVTPSSETLHYRNRMDYAVGWLGTVGLKEYGSWNRYLDLSTCLLLSQETPKILEIVRGFIRERGLEPWDAKHHSGLLRYVVIREGKKTNQRMIMLVVSSLERITDDVRTELVERLSPLCTSLLLGEQKLPTDISLVQHVVALHGEPWIEEEVNDIRYRLAPNSFFQTNSHMAAVLQNTVCDIIATVKPKTLLDLYCGLGFFGIATAKRFPEMRVAGFEIDAEAIELARHNAHANGVGEQTHFSAGPAEDLSWKEIPADAIILDPPRAGLHPKVLATILERIPADIVYVSCNYHRFVEELKTFKTHYDVVSLAALDLFPQTPHVEVVAHLRRKTDSV